jgi:selT/selW/selH-like putative selenoprotein
VSLKNALEREFEVPVRLRAGGPGALDVYLNGEQVFSKKRSGRLPLATELIGLIRGNLPTR